MKVGLYSGGWIYPQITGGTADFSSYPLWTAAYPADGQPPNFDTFKPYGGWTRPLIWQYKGSTQLDGLNVDLNAAASAFWEEPMPEHYPGELNDRRAMQMVQYALNVGSIRFKELPDGSGYEVLDSNRQSKNPPEYIKIKIEDWAKAT